MRLKISYFFSNFFGEIDVTDPLLHFADNRCDLSFSTLVAQEAGVYLLVPYSFLGHFFSSS